MSKSSSQFITRGSADSLNTFQLFDTEDDLFGFPSLLEQDIIIPDRLISYSNSVPKDSNKCGLHFYIDDYRFETLWNRPQLTLKTIKKYGCVISPDFSLYENYPHSLKIWNIYRSRWLSRYWQENNIIVIPNVTWADEESFAYCFKGIPKNYIVAVSFMGSTKKDVKEKFLLGFEEMIKQLKPKILLAYGKTDINLEDYVETVHRFSTYWEEYRNGTKDKK